MCLIYSLHSVFGLLWGVDQLDHMCKVLWIILHIQETVYSNRVLPFMSPGYFEELQAALSHFYDCYVYSGICNSRSVIWYYIPDYCIW